MNTTEKNIKPTSSIEKAKTGFFRLLVSATSQESSKRFVVIACILAFIGMFVTMIVLLILLFIRTLTVSDNSVTLFFKLFELVVNCAFYIICFGVGATAIVSVGHKFGEVLLEKARAKIIAAQKGTPNTEVHVDNVEQVNTNKPE